MSETFQYLTSKYNKVAINRHELANELGVSLSTIDRQLKSRRGLPNFKRMGEGTKARILFPLSEVSIFIETQLMEVE